MPNPECSNRNEFIDVCKGIGILLVYYGHSAYWGTLPSRIVFSFHMPLFFLLSGFVFNVAKISSLRALLRKVTRNLLLPYIIFVIIGCLMKYDETFLNWKSDPIGMVIRIIHGEGSNSIWFLSCLSMVQILAWCFLRWAARFERRFAIGILASMMLVVACGISLIVPESVVSRLPFMSASVPSCLFFFSIGVMCKDELGEFPFSPFKMSSLLLILPAIFAGLVCVNILQRDTFDLRSAKFTVTALPSCVLGLMLVAYSAKAAMAIPFVYSVLSGIGKRSLCLFALELPCSYIIAKVTSGIIPGRMWLVSHNRAWEPIRIVVILAMVWLLSYPAMRMLEQARRYVHVKA